MFEDLKPISEKIKIPLVKTYSFDSLEECILSFENMSFNFEGYVGRLDNQRIKIHNPVWALVHQKGKRQATEIDLTDKSIFLDIVKQGGIGDFIAEFPQTSEIVLNLQKTYFESISKLEEVFNIVYKPKNISKEESKKFAENVFKTLSDFGVNSSLSQIIFLLQQGKTSSVENYFKETPNKKLYNWLTK